MSFVKRLPVDLSASADKVNGAFLSKRMRQDQVGTLIRLECHVQDGPRELDWRYLSEGLTSQHPDSRALALEFR